MKIRYDFVSNSSSCSFIVGLENEQSINSFKKLIGFLKKNDVSMVYYPDLSSITYRANAKVFSGTKQDIKLLEPGSYMVIDTGEDHYDGFEEKFNMVLNKFGKSFKLFQDDSAHLTFGNDLPPV